MIAAAFLLFVSPANAAAQSSIGIGPRVTFVRGGESSDGSQRFSGGALRMGSGRTAIELAMDYRSATTGDLTERITDYPIQASLLLYPVRARIAPYVVGGVGWYSQNVKRFTTAGTSLLDDETTRKMGYHAGFGGELRLHRRVGLHGDYRYTVIRFGDDDQTTAAGGPSSTPGWIPFAERLKLSHEGSMFTWGATFYF
jgi:opacity protein-like surface antigen